MYTDWHSLLGVKKGEIQVEVFVSSITAQTNIEVFALANAIQRPLFVVGSDEDVVVYGAGYYGCAGVFPPYRHDSKMTCKQPLCLAWNESYCPASKPTLVPLCMVEIQSYMAGPWPIDYIMPAKCVVARDPFKKKHKALRDYVDCEHTKRKSPAWVDSLIASMDYIVQLPVPQRIDPDVAAPFLKPEWYADPANTHATGTNVEVVEQKQNVKDWLEQNDLEVAIFAHELRDVKTVHSLLKMSQADLAYLELPLDDIERLCKAIFLLKKSKNYVDKKFEYESRIEKLKAKVGTQHHLDEGGSGSGSGGDGYTGDSISEWVEFAGLDPSLTIFLQSDGITSVAQLLNMSAEDIDEKPDSGALKAAVDKLRAQRSGAGGAGGAGGGYAGEDIAGWLEYNNLDPELMFFLESDGITTVSGLLDMSAEDITEKPNGDALKAAIDKLRADRAAASGGGGYAGDDMAGWLSFNNLEPDLEFFLMSDGVTTGE